MLEWLKNVVDCVSMNRLFKAVNLQNESLSMELNSESEERRKLVERMSDKINKWSGKGKLYEQIYSLTRELLEHNK